MAEARPGAALLAAAHQDLLACRVLAAVPGIGDAIIGFHAQQCVEKSLKCVLARAGIAYRRTHDLAELLDLVADRRLDPPPGAEWLDELNPYGVAARYGLIVPDQLDRVRALASVEAVYAWAADYRPSPSDGAPP